MPKVYLDKNVYDAATERFQTVLEEFDNYYISVSGGKDSSVMLQLMAQEARKAGRKFSVLYIDLEAQYQATMAHINELIDCTKDVVDNWYWVAMPLSLRNAVSAIQPKWICWDKKDKKKWVREYPTKRKDVVLCTEDKCPDGWGWFYHGMEFEEFILWFAKWFNGKYGGKTAAGIGIRSDESLNRFRTIVSVTKESFKNYPWTTRVHCKSETLDCWNFYPLYDWGTEDDWVAVAKLGLKFNQIYELMYKNGLSIHEQRLCQPYGDDQRKGLDQFRALEPETWEKVLNRVEGVNFGNIYCRTSLLGNIKSEKPDSMTWEQYAVFLLESIGLYAPEVRDHYHKKIKTFMAWWEKEAGITPDKIQDDKWEIEGFRQAPYWKRIARAIEKNDFWMSGLSFSQTKKDVQRLIELKEKYSNLIRPGIQSTNKQLRQISEMIGDAAMKKTESMVKKEFSSGYDKREFYAIMGQFFAEEKYRKEMPYIKNSDKKGWSLFYIKDNLVGFYSHEQIKDVAQISSVYVLEEFRRMGVFTEMLKDMINCFCNIKITSNNDILLNLLLKNGFKKISARGSYNVMERIKNNGD